MFLTYSCTAGPSDLKTDEFIRRAAKTHASMSACETAAFLKDILEESIRSTGVKFPAAFMRLPYFDLLKNVIIDGMHQIRNIGLHCHEGLMGFDFSPAVREHARMNGMHPSWWKRSRNSEGELYMSTYVFNHPPNTFQTYYERVWHVFLTCSEMRFQVLSTML